MWGLAWPIAMSMPLRWINAHVWAEQLVKYGIVDQPRGGLFCVIIDRDFRSCACSLAEWSLSVSWRHE